MNNANLVNFADNSAHSLKHLLNLLRSQQRIINVVLELSPSNKLHLNRILLLVNVHQLRHPHSLPQQLFHHLHFLHILLYTDRKRD